MCAYPLPIREGAYVWAPNDEAFEGHPLASRGLKPYSVFEVKNSSWIRRLERMNSVHRCHRPEGYKMLRHFVFAFHDTTFECVAQGFEWTVHEGIATEILFQSLPPALPEIR